MLFNLTLELRRTPMRSSNPALITNPFSGGFGLVSESDAMTIRGTVNKTAVLLLLVVLPAAWVWKQFYLAGQNPAAVQGWMLVGLFGGFILSLVTIFKKNWAPISAPLYAVMQGLFLGGISGTFEKSYPGIVMQAVSLSMATLLVMLVAYQAGWIRPSERFRWGIVAATGAIALVYFASIILGFFNIQIPIVTGSSLFSILFSFFVVGIAALNFILDFDFIEQGSRGGVPKYMEWYGAFALMVTLIWLYIEILRLLAKINERR
jgi:uncharacterized YccA/Bax inhibitor family protein